MDRGRELLDAAQGRRVLVSRHRARGVTLIELLIAIAIVSLLFAMGLPAFSTFMANNKVRNAAEVLSSTLAFARSEAMRRNRNVEFVMTNDEVDLGTLDTITAHANGINWVVRSLNPTTGTYDLIEARSGYEGSGSKEGGGIAVQVNANAPLITFRGLGGTQGLAGTATFDFSNPSGGACHTTATPGPIRCLRVQVSVAGLVRMCDPSVDPVASPGDTRAC
jgi:type IV fimbrial biogenesis protein FimT